MALTAEKAEAIGEVTAYGLVPGGLFEDEEALEAVGAGTRRDTEIGYIVVEDSLGRTLGAYAKDVYRVVESIRHGERDIGKVHARQLSRARCGPSAAGSR
jgi:hypothetical protein